MSETLQITCINKTDRLNPHERIHSIGGNANGKQWKLSQPEAIAGIADGRWQFFVKPATADSVWVIVAFHGGTKYLKTENDGEQPNNLLSLPECL